MQDEILHTKQCGPFTLRWDTAQNLDVFERALLRTWARIPEAMQGPILKGCDHIFYAKKKLPYYVGRNHVAMGVMAPRPGGRSHVEIQADVCDESNFDGVCNLIAHELRHVWQHATDWLDSQDIDQASRREAVRRLVEDDADQFALSLFPPSNDLFDPVFYHMDKGFRELQRAWDSLEPGVKHALCRVAKGERDGLRESVDLCWQDQRYLDIRDAWQLLDSDGRDKISRIFREAIELHCESR